MCLHYKNYQEGYTVECDASYDRHDEELTYSFILASDYMFENVIVSEDNLRLPIYDFGNLEPGQYYIRIRAKNESGYEQDCFDYYSVSSLGKVYGAKAFIINEDGTSSDVDIEDV